MSISINNNPHTQSYHPAAKSGKTTTDAFNLPEPQDMPVAEAFEARASGKMSDEEFAIYQKQFISQARMLPPEIMNGNRLLEFQEANTAKIVFEFGEGGSIRIKEGLSPEDYARAKATLRDIEFWRSGGTLPTK